MNTRLLPGIKPLTARSVVLTTLLGYHPPELPVGALVRVGALFGMAERTVRVALSRMVADGDLVAEGGVYRLTDRLVERQKHQEDSVFPRVKRWRGGWDMAVVTAPPRPLADRVALRKTMLAMRLAELREGVWVRPANLVVDPDGVAAEQCTFFQGRPDGDPVGLARSLWDLDDWAATARQLRAELDRAGGLAGEFVATAAVWRHLLIDPVLPPELLPVDWPGEELRRHFSEARRSFATRLRDYSAG